MKQKKLVLRDSLLWDHCTVNHSKISQ